MAQEWFYIVPKEETVEKGGKGSGWFAPPKGTHGSKKSNYGDRYKKVKGSAEAVKNLSIEYMKDAGLTDSEIESVFSDGNRWVKEFNMSNHPFQKDIRNGTARAKAIHGWNQEVLGAEKGIDIVLHRGVNATQVKQMRDNRKGQYTWIGVRPASSWSESRKVASTHAGREGGIVSGTFPIESSFMSYRAFPTIFGTQYEGEHVMVAGKQEGALRWLRLKGTTVSEE